MTKFEIFSWFLAFLSLTGNVFVIKKNVIGQWIWAFANFGWIAFDLYIGAYAQAFLFASYFGMCIWGIITWTKEAKQAQAQS